MTQPNVLFILSDQHRWDFMGYESNGVTYTPNLDQLAAGGAAFSRAYCTSPLCGPSRAALASGRYGMNSGCFTNLHELPASTPTFVQQLREHAYRTCAIGKTHMQIHGYSTDYTSAGYRAHMDSLGWDESQEVVGNGMMRTGIRCAYSAYLKEAGVYEEVLDYYRKWAYFMSPDADAWPAFSCHPWPFAEEHQEARFTARTAIERAGGAKRGLEDVFWALLNSKEFLYNH